MKTETYAILNFGAYIVLGIISFGHLGTLETTTNAVISIGLLMGGALVAIALTDSLEEK